MPAEGEMRAPHSELPAITADVLERIREKRPRVHCITNAVAQNFTANMLLAGMYNMTVSFVSDFSPVYLPTLTSAAGTENCCTEYSAILTFALVVAILAVRPLGLFGRPA